MSSHDDEFDDDRPRRRPRDDDDDDDRPARPRRSRDDEDDRAPPRPKSHLGLILGIVFGILILVCGGGGVAVYFALKGAVSKVGDAADRMNSTNNLKQIGLGVLEYEGKVGALPGNSYGPDGKPLLSWRVHILPFVEEDALYKQFKLDEPWDSPNNRRLLDQMPLVYATPAERKGRTPRGNKTYYRGFAGGGGAFGRPETLPGVKGRDGPGQPPAAGWLTLSGFKHGLSNTPLVVEARDPVEWTRPDDLDLSAGKPFPAFGGIRPNDSSFMVLFGDGSVRAVHRTVPEAEWRKAINVAGPQPGNLD